MKKKILLSAIILMLASTSWATTTVSVTAHTANTTAQSATENTNNSNLANAINTHNAATTGEHGVTGTIVGTSDTQSLTNKTITLSNDLTLNTGIKAIFGNSARYLIDDTSVYAVECSTHMAIPQGAKLYLDGGGSYTHLKSSANGYFEVMSGAVTRLQITDTGDCLIQGVYDDTTGNAANVYVGTNGSLSRSTSARKYKTNERPLLFDKTKLMGLQPIIYNSKCANDDPKKDYIGLVADDAIKQYPELVTVNNGVIEGFQYERLTVILLKAIQEHQNTIDSQAARISNLEKRMAILEKKVGGQ